MPPLSFPRSVLRLAPSLLAVAAASLAPACFGQEPAPAQAPPVKGAYETFALGSEGDAARGRELFASTSRTLCALCHTVDGRGGLAGPDLSGIGDKFPRRELIRSVLDPSSTIAVGYATTRVTLETGGEAVGVVKQATDAFVELVGADGRPRRIERRDIASQTNSDVSLMPEGLQAALSLPEFSDLIAYLQSLRQAPAGARGEEVPRARRAVTFEPDFTSAIRLDHPLWFGEVPGLKDTFAVLEHGGQSWIIERTPEGEKQTQLLDLRGVVRRGGASGLLGMAFHPKFAENRKYYLNYQIVENGQISTLVVERRFAENLRSDSGEPGRPLFKIPSSTQDHQGGCLQFGPDGFLYIGMGDTGPQGDPQGHGQDLNLLIGKMLRVDVDHPDNGLPYGIPAGNPFAGKENIRPEIWAYGFREPWRFSFDSLTHDLWVGDVGQDRIEEVGIVRVGENHGWNVYEGPNRFSERYRREGVAYVPPIFSYPHRVGVSVTGGCVYRGKRAERMAGRYVCADFETRRVWALTQTDRVLGQVVEIGRAPSRAVSFTETRDGELHLVGYDSGMIYRLALENVDPRPVRTRVLAETSERKPVAWRFTTETPAAGWMRPEFDDAAWRQAPGGFGTAGTPGGAIRTEWNTGDIWLRRDCVVDETKDPSRPRVVSLRVHHDEDAEIYLNGTPVANLPRWTQGYVDIPLSPEAARALRPGRNVLAVHCHQNNGGQYIDAGLVEEVEGD